jgi:hypothetical protein
VQLDGAQVGEREREPTGVRTRLVDGHGLGRQFACALRVGSEEGDPAEVIQGFRDAPLISCLAVAAQRLLEVTCRFRQVPLLVGEDGEAGEHAGAHGLVVMRRWQVERRAQPLAPLRVESANDPEPAQSGSQPESANGIPRTDRPVEGGSKVVVLATELLQCLRLAGPREGGFVRFRDGDRDIRMRGTRAGLLTAGRELLESELAHGLEHAEPRLAILVGILAQQTLVDEGGDSIERGDAGIT